MALAGALTVALVALALDHQDPAPRPKRALVDRKCVEPPRAAEQTCPTWVRARLRVDHNAVIACSYGNYGEPAWFVHAFYQTTELWERYAIFAAEGAREVVSPVDRPSVFTSASFRAGDLDGDGVDEVLVRYPGAHELMQLRNGELTTHLVRDAQP